MENKYEKDLILLKGFAIGKDYNSMLTCIAVAVKLHEEQTRKSGEPYISHPVRVTNGLLLLGIKDEVTLSAAMLHDVVEDCNITIAELRDVYGIPEPILNLVDLLSKIGRTTDKYYEDLRRYPGAILIKLADRCHNISTMVGAFGLTKINDYTEETEQKVLPLAKFAAKAFPQYSSAIYYMRYHIESVLDALKIIEQHD